MKRFTYCGFISFSALAMVLMGAMPAQAAVAVGDKPELSVPAVGGGTIDLKKLKGKIVMLDFWATWCRPCMDEAPHMVEINKKYGPKGLQIIGISLDNDAATMQRVAKEVGFTWPQHIDKGDVKAQFGVSGIPSVFLIGPEGDVLWQGHPANLDAALEKAFKENPPRLVDEKILVAAQELLTSAEGKAQDGDAVGAIKLMGRIPKAAKVDEDFAAKFEEVSKSLEASAGKLLKEVEPQIEKGEYVEAIARLKDLSASLEGTDTGKEARRRLTQVQAMPAARKAVQTAQKEGKAKEGLAVAQKLKSSGKHELAYPRFKALAKQFPDTAAGAKAAKAVAQYENDKEFVQRVMEKEASVKAKGTLNIARAYAKNNRPDLARSKYQSIIDEYPGTSFAKTAEQEMAALGS